MNTRGKPASTHTTLLFSLYILTVLTESYGDIPPARWCTIYNAEQKKCEEMKKAFNEQSLKPEIECVQKHQSLECMEAIMDGKADLATFDVGDVYTAGTVYGLVPIMAEQYPDGLESYVVAFAKASDINVTMATLEGKRSCHGGIKMAAGWVVPMSTLLQRQLLERQGCKGPEQVRRQYYNFTDTMSAGDFFGESCVPGSSWEAYNGEGVNPYKLCDWCVGNSQDLNNYANDLCARNQGEDYYGNIGSFRCLMEGGDVSFTRHQVVIELKKHSRSWAEGIQEDDYVILCEDGSRKPIYDYKLDGCHLGKIPSNVVMASSNNTQENIDAYKNLLLEGQHIYGSDEHDFQMFQSGEYYTDLLFSDVTERLEDVGKRNTYSSWLGEDYLHLQDYLTGCPPPPSETLQLSVGHTFSTNTLLSTCLVAFVCSFLNL
ncbi:otolith matrix protein 1-like [Ptychodera flava]|uniref:otolith matrix protein 1-like n=1 Tax=Ptychodera flava TaxID=63121 RepID=UPI00396A5CE9